MASNVHFTLYIKTRSSGIPNFSNLLNGVGGAIVSTFFSSNNNATSNGSGGERSFTASGESRRSLTNSSSVTSSGPPVQTATTNGPENAQPVSKDVMDYRYHILLRCVSRQEEFIVSVSDNLKEIHENWNWIERQLFPRISEISSDLDITPQLEKEPGGQLPGSTQIKVENSLKLALDDFVLSQFDVEVIESNTKQQPKIYQSKKRNEIADMMDNLFHLENQHEIPLYYYSCAVVKDNENSSLIRGTLFFTQSFACFYSLSHSDGEHFLLPLKDVLNLQMTNDRKLLLGESIQVETRTGKVYETLVYLCDQAMKKLVKGTEESKYLKRSESSDWDKYRMTRASSLELTVDPYGSNDGNPINNSGINSGTSPIRATGSHSDLPVADIGELRRNEEFCRIFRLAKTEVPIETHTCSFYFEPLKKIMSGLLYVTSNFICFSSPSNRTTLNIPFRIVSTIRKYNVMGFLATKYIVINTVNRFEYQFFGFKNRASTFEMLSTLLKNCAQVLGELDTATSPFTKKPRSLSNHDTASSKFIETTDGVKRVADGGEVNNELAEGERDEPPTSPLSSMFSNYATLGLHFLFPEASAEGTNDTSAHESMELERKLELKWLEYFRIYGRDVSMIIAEDEFRRLLLHGIPELFRSSIWLFLSGVVNNERQEEQSYWAMLKESHNNMEREDFKSILDEIEKDVKRSLPEHPAFQASEGVDALRRLLSAFAYRNQDIGYAQSMNIVASIFLLYLPEQQAFQLLCALCERILPDHYSKSLVGAVLDQRVFEELLREYVPPVHEKLIGSMGLELSLITFPWFVCLFINSFPIRYACRVLDVFLFEGPVFLFWLALAVFQIQSRALLSARDEEQVMVVIREYFDQFRSNRLEVEEVMSNLLDLAYEYSFAFGNRKIEELRYKFRLEVVQKLEDTNRRMTVRNMTEISSFSQSQVEAIYGRVREKTFSSDSMSSIPFETFQLLCRDLIPWWSQGSESILFPRFYQFCLTRGAGKVGLSEIIELCDVICNRTLNDRLLFLFNIHDDDNDGNLSEFEFSNLIQSLRCIVGLGNESLQRDIDNLVADETLEGQSFISAKTFLLLFHLQSDLSLYMENNRFTIRD